MELPVFWWIVQLKVNLILKNSILMWSSFLEAFMATVDVFFCYQNQLNQLNVSFLQANHLTYSQVRRQTFGILFWVLTNCNIPQSVPGGRPDDEGAARLFERRELHQSQAVVAVGLDHHVRPVRQCGALHWGMDSFLSVPQVSFCQFSSHFDLQ